MTKPKRLFLINFTFLFFYWHYFLRLAFLAFCPRQFHGTALSNRGSNLRLIEFALFKLCLNGKLNLDEAKVINSLYSGNAVSFKSLLRSTGLEDERLFNALNGLIKSGIVLEKSGFYHLKNFESKFLELIEIKGKQTVLQAFEK